MEVSGQLHGPAALPPGKSHSTPWKGGWVGPRAGMDEVAKRKKKMLALPRIESRPSWP